MKAGSVIILWHHRGTKLATSLDSWATVVQLWHMCVIVLRHCDTDVLLGHCGTTVTKLCHKGNNFFDTGPLCHWASVGPLWDHCVITVTTVGQLWDHCDIAVSQGKCFVGSLVTFVF